MLCSYWRYTGILYSINASLNSIHVISATSLKWDFLLSFNFANCQFSNTCISRDGGGGWGGVLQNNPACRIWDTCIFMLNLHVLYYIFPQKGFLSVDHSARRSQQGSGSLNQHYLVCFEYIYQKVGGFTYL